MQPIQPIGGQPQPALPSAERAAPQVALAAANPNLRPETSRPVTAPEKAPRIEPQASDPARPQPDAPPMSLIVEAMTRSGDESPDRQPEKLVPPVPVRYLSALMLQTLRQGEETVNAKS